MWFIRQFVSAPYLLNPLDDFHSTSFQCSTQEGGVQSTWPSNLNSRSRSQVMVEGLMHDFQVRSISLEPSGRFSFSFTQMFISVRRCAEIMTRLHRLKVKVTLQGHVIYPSIRVRCISPEYFWTLFINLHSNVPLSEVECRTNDSATPQLSIVLIPRREAGGG